MSALVRLFTLITIAAAGFALPINCAQVGAADSTSIEIPVVQQADPTGELPTGETGANSAQSIAQRLFDKLPIDCGDGATPSVAEHPATFDTQPFVPGYLESTVQLAEASSGVFAPPPALITIESRAGPPDAPPPKPID